MAFVDRALDLPRVWADDGARREAARIPKEIRFATNPALAKQLLARAFVAKVPARWVVADSFDGRAHHVRHWLEEEGKPPIVGVLPGQVVEYDGQRQRAQAVAERLPSEAWVRHSAGEGSQGPRVHDWVVVDLSETYAAGRRRWLLVRRSPVDPTDLAYFRAYGPAETTAEDLVQVAAMRWAIEEGFAQAKGEVGLDHSEVRRWDAWHRLITLALLVHAYVAAVRARTRQIPEDPVQKSERALVRR
jgi:SRSO17 transposase